MKDELGTGELGRAHAREDLGGGGGFRAMGHGQFRR